MSKPRHLHQNIHNLRVYEAPKIYMLRFNCIISRRASAIFFFCIPSSFLYERTTSDRKDDIRCKVYLAEFSLHQFRIIHICSTGPVLLLSYPCITTQKVQFSLILYFISHANSATPPLECYLCHGLSSNRAARPRLIHHT